MVDGCFEFSSDHPRSPPSPLSFCTVQDGGDVYVQEQILRRNPANHVLVHGQVPRIGFGIGPAAHVAGVERLKSDRPASSATSTCARHQCGPRGWQHRAQASSRSARFPCHGASGWQWRLGRRLREGGRCWRGLEQLRMGGEPQ